MKNIAFLLLVASGLLFIMGLVLLLADKIPWLGNLPGDMELRFKDVRIHFPLMSCLLISLSLTIILNILSRFFGK